MSDIPEQDTSEHIAEEQGAPKKKRASRLWLAAAALLIVFLAIPYVYTSNPQSCTRCHNMQKYYDSWQKSSHSVAAGNCFDCHVRQGTISLWVYRISFYREIYASIVGADLKPVGATLPGIHSCQRSECHTLNREFSASGDIKINHRIHVTKADIPCIKCHPGAAHPNVGKIGKLVPPRKLCMECHASRRDDCNFCHSKRFSFSSQFSH